jgi:hypothetical protein
VTPSEFARHFATKDALIMSIVDDLVRASGTALGKVKTDTAPEHSMLIATIEVLAPSSMAVVSSRVIECLR